MGNLCDTEPKKKESKELSKQINISEVLKDLVEVQVHIQSYF